MDQNKTVRKSELNQNQDMADDWIAMDKLEHFVICFLIVMVSALSIRLTINPTKILHRWATWVGCILSLTAGATKELGDEMGIWPSAGGSIKDGLADGGGILFAVILLHFIKRQGSKPINKGLVLHGPVNV